MPKIVDHDERRAEIVRATTEVIGRTGLVGTTIRAAAKEIGVAPASLGHYFRTRGELVAAVGESLLRETEDAIARATDGKRGLTALLALLGVLGTPATAESALPEARLVVGFWNDIATHGDAADHHDAHVGWHRAAVFFLREGVEMREVRSDAPVDLLGPVLVSLSISGTIEVILGTDLASSARQRQLIDVALRPYLADQALRNLDAFVQLARGGDVRY